MLCIVPPGMWAAGLAMWRLVVGFIMAWLKSCEACGDKNEHKNKALLRGLAGPDCLEWRSELRAQVPALDGGAGLLSHEGRDPKPDEGPEPARVI